MKTKALILLSFVLVLAWAGTAVAQSSLSADLRVENAAPLTIGDPVALIVTVVHPDGYRVIAPALGQTWGELRIVSQSAPATRSSGDGTATTEIALDARLFAPGEFQTPPLTLQVTDGSGQLLEVTAVPVPITITPILTAAESDLRDIKPQAELPYRSVLPWVAGGLLTAVALGAFFWWQRRRVQPAPATADNRTPYEVALDDLAYIETMALAENGRFKEHFTLVSDVVRTYIERLYQVPLHERTTAEARHSLRASSLDAATQRQIVKLLHASDLVKFSDSAPDAADAVALLAEARVIVEAARPQPEPSGDAELPPPPPPHRFGLNGRARQMEIAP